MQYFSIMNNTYSGKIPNWNHKMLKKFNELKNLDIIIYFKDI